MRDHVEICLRVLTGAKGRWSNELEAFWRDVERSYKCCNVMMIPQEHIPLWYARMVDQRIPIEASTLPPPSPAPPPVLESSRIDGRTREARLMRLQTAGV